MTPLKCELCGSTDFVKEGNYFVCQHCRTKYTKEDAQKIVGTIKIDTTEKTEKLYDVARQSIKTSDFESAAKYYDEIRQEQPNDWESALYSVYSKAMKCKIIEIGPAADAIARTTPLVFSMIKNNISDSAEQVKAYSEVVMACISAADFLSKATHDYHFGIDMNIRANDNDAYQARVFSCCLIDYTCGEQLIKNFEEDDLTKSLACNAYKKGVEIEGLALKVVMGEKLTAPILKDMKSWENRIKQYDPTYSIPEESKKSGGCYVATCVYGSYDCPEVWTLRRYRDDTLAKTWYGRTFIHTYYAISPTLVKWFGDTNWFKKMWKPRLNTMIKNLQRQGVEATPYQDKEW